MPASFCRAAGTTRGRGVSSGTNSAARREIPPPRMIRSGQRSWSMRSMYSSRRCGPRLHAQLLGLADRGRRPQLGVLAAHLDVAELGVRHQPAVEEERRADARAERQHQDHPAHAGAGAVAHLGQAGGVGVVQERAGAADGRREELLGRGADPRLVQVGGGHHHAAHDRRRQADPDRPVRREGADHLGRRGDHGLGGGRLRRLEPHALGGQRAPLQVHQGALDAAPADVDAERRGARGGRHGATSSLA